MEVCSRRRGLVTLGRIISSPQSVAYRSGPDNINQLVKLLVKWIARSPNNESLGRNLLENQERSAVVISEPSADRMASHGLLET